MDSLLFIAIALSGALLGFFAALVFMRSRGSEETRLALQFENLANKIFDEKNDRFKRQSQENLTATLAPLKETIADFRKKIDDNFGQQAKEQFALKTEIARIVAVNERMTLQTESLAKALRGDVKVQGNWGEMVLEKLLEDSGLRAGEDYDVQGGNMNLRGEDGRRLLPDVIVRLPGGKHIIIDSKLVLLSYERFCTEQDDEEKKKKHLSDFLAALRAHVSNLSQKAYQDADKLDTPDFVLMFMPIEAAWALALQSDRDLHRHAWEKRVVIVSPSTLFATLRTVASLWRMERQNRNAMEIARRGGALYDKVAGFVADMEKLGRQIDQAQDAYGAAMNKLSKGQGNLLRQTEQIRELGAKTAKKLPDHLTGKERD